jgi:glycosyltransferase involved in cell wall biosynthesis
MKILYVTSTAPFGNQESFIIPEIEELRSQGNDVMVVPLYPRGPIVHGDAQSLLPITVKERVISTAVAASAICEFVRQPLRTISAVALVLGSRTLKIAAKNVSVLPKALWLVWLGRKFGAEHIHAQWGGCTATVAMVASRVSAIPWSVTVHRWDIQENNLLSAKISTCKFIRAIDRNGVNELERHSRKYSERIVLLHVGVEVPPAFERPTTSGSVLRILVPAMLVPKKGHSYMIKALRLLISRGIAATADFVGDGELEKEIRAEILEAGIQDRVKILGIMAHDQLLRGMTEGKWDAVVLPSIVVSNAKNDKEGIPVALVEAMARYLPVISTETGGIPELLGGGAGILVPARNSDALADAMQLLVSNRALRQKLALAGRKRVEESFSVKPIIAKFMYLLENQGSANAVCEIQADEGCPRFERAGLKKSSQCQHSKDRW